jgi:hypothetical protein
MSICSLSRSGLASISSTTASSLTSRIASPKKASQRPSIGSSCKQSTSTTVFINASSSAMLPLVLDSNLRTPPNSRTIGLDPLIDRCRLFFTTPRLLKTLLCTFSRLHAYGHRRYQPRTSRSPFAGRKGTPPPREPLLVLWHFWPFRQLLPAQGSPPRPHVAAAVDFGSPRGPSQARTGAILEFATKSGTAMLRV